MAYFSWVAAAERTNNAALTVLVQAISPNDQDQLLWDVFFPRQDVPSVEIDTLTALIPTRFVSDRREWNARGRYIPQEFGGAGRLEMIPIEAFFRLAEREIQRLEERGQGSEEFLKRQMGVSIPERTASLARANYRRIELDTFNAWATGEVTVVNPVTGNSYVASYGWASAATRYTTASPAWTGGVGGTAYTKLMNWLRAGVEAGVNIGGVMTRLSTREAIRSSAPNIAFPNATAGTFEPILSDVEKRIQDELGLAFRFYLNERHVDSFTGAGTATAPEKLWPDHTLAVVPAGEVVGYNAFAPVARAFDVSRAAPEAEIDVNGMTAYTETENNGRGLVVECQVNALPVPNENNLWVIDTGI